MSLRAISFCGATMNAETYDDDVALRAYVLQHFSHLMTPLERRVTEYVAPIVSCSEDLKIRKLHAFLEERDGHVEDADVLSEFKNPHGERIKKAVDRLLDTRRGEVIENRCPQCQRLPRTPIARQCLWCGHDWH